VNTDAPWPSLEEARTRVLGIQTKLHRWAADDRDRRFCDLYNLVCDPAFLVVAWARVRGNKGARTAGVDGVTARAIEARKSGAVGFLGDLRADLKARMFSPLPVAERLIPKRGRSRYRRLGIPATRDRVVQAALKLVLEPILEADFLPSSYGFRPNRRAHDAVAEVRLFTAKRYEWVVEGDIENCFDELSHVAIMDRLRKRIGDRRVLALVKAFLKAGILSRDGAEPRDTITGTPQGGILSPLLANLALEVLDEHFAARWPNRHVRGTNRRYGRANNRLVRYADDFVVAVAGTRDQAESLISEVAAVLAPIGLRLSEEKTRVVYIDEGLDFLGWRIQRHVKPGTLGRQYVYTYPSKPALRAVMDKVRTLTRRDTRNMPLVALLGRLNPVLRGWTAYFQPGVSSRTFNYMRTFVWRRVIQWLRRKHPHASWKELRRRFCGGGWWPRVERGALFDPGSVHTTRYRYRGAAIPTPWSSGVAEAVT
jgi:RNA-directed DNA polymerase